MPKKSQAYMIDKYPFSVRLTKQEREALKIMAWRQQLTVSDFIREKLDADFRKGHDLYVELAKADPNLLQGILDS